MDLPQAPLAQGAERRGRESVKQLPLLVSFLAALLGNAVAWALPEDEEQPIHIVSREIIRDETAGLIFELGTNVTNQSDELAGRLFPRLDTGLMIGVHVHEAGVEGDRPFVECDQGTQRSGIEVIQADGDRLAVLFSQGLAGAAEKSL